MDLFKKILVKMNFKYQYISNLKKTTSFKYIIMMATKIKEEIKEEIKEKIKEKIKEEVKGDNFKEFDDINISTMTIIMTTNLEMDLEWLYDILPVPHFDTKGVVIKTNKDFQNYMTQLNPPYGTITMVQYKEHLKGFKIRKKKQKFFRNALSIVMYVGKLVTIKIPTKGKLQMTGCIGDDQSEMCIKYFWNILQQHTPSPNTYFLSGNSKCLETTVNIVMTNIIFKMGYHINRQNLDLYMNQCTDFNSLLETSFGYTGVNIKIPFKLIPEETKIKQMKCNEYGVWETSFISYNAYIQSLSDRDREKELSKKRRNTFLVFHSGTAIMSGMTTQYMKDVYDKFISIMREARNEIEETIITT
jgi:hypothetical protein